jgi:Pyruvate/2-oxoacid:ferredoxin oxidoreductase delta subunit
VFEFLGLGKFDKILSRFENIPLDVFEGSCVCVRDKAAKCKHCVDNCPVSAIKIIDNHPEVDMSKCNGCGICANVCPTGVFELKEAPDDKLLSRIEAALKHTQILILTCGEAQRSNNNPELKNAITVSCIGRINEAVLIGSVVLGASTIWLNGSNCDECNQKQGLEVAGKVVSGVNKLLETFGNKSDIYVSSELPKGKSIQLSLSDDELPLEERLNQYSRRDFLRYFQKNAMATGALIIESSIMDKLKIFQEPKKEEKTGLEYRLSSKRNLLLNFLPKLGKARKRKTLNENLPFAQVKINNNCTACELCVLFCPTKALDKKTKRNNKSEINFNLSYCVKCDLCKVVCEDKAIEYPDYINPQLLANNKRKSLVKYGIYECKKCKLKFSSVIETDYCKFCKRKKEIFES